MQTRMGLIGKREEGLREVVSSAEGLLETLYDATADPAFWRVPVPSNHTAQRPGSAASGGAQAGAEVTHVVKLVACAVVRITLTRTAASSGCGQELAAVLSLFWLCFVSVLSLFGLCFVSVLALFLLSQTLSFSLDLLSLPLLCLRCRASRGSH